ncbi:hypothetical protein WME90_29425 [Sorangium sp. So ce375]|uniref:hypothetical protein n=1 Tax=Sorangium sp. So ce375 TaxID=3133306 RepID=UPI003F5C8B9D
MFFSASAAWYAGRYVAPSGSPSSSKSEQNVALAGHPPVGAPLPVLAAAVVSGVPVPVVLLLPLLVLLASLPPPLVVVLPPPLVVVPPPLVPVVLLLPLPLLPATGLPAPELTLAPPPVPAPLPPAPPVSEESFAPSEQPAAAADRARQEIPTQVKRAISR